MLALVVAASQSRGWGILEWFFAALLAGMVLLVGGFFLFLIGQLFLNPGRRARRL